MKNSITPTTTLPTTKLQETGIEILTAKLTETSNALYNTSKDKYDLKVKLIKEAKDLNTKEKLDELDKNYNKHVQESWQNFATFCLLGLSLAGIAVGTPIIIKSIQKNIA